MYEQMTVLGNLGADPEMRYTASGKLVTNFSLAANARWTNSAGEPQERVTWYRVACWGRLAEVCNEYLSKGRRVMVVASRIEAEAYLDKEGQPQAALKLTADRVTFLDGASAEEVQEAIEEEVAF